MSDRQEIFTRWVADFRPMLFRIARAYAATPADVEDLVQDMLLALWRSLPSFRGASRPSTWIFRVALRVALDQRRTMARRIRTQPEAPGNLDRAAADRDTEVEQIDRLHLSRVLAAIRELPVVDRTVLVLALEGASLEETAEVVGITAGNAGVRLHRARRRLVERMGA